MSGDPVGDAFAEAVVVVGGVEVIEGALGDFALAVTFFAVANLALFQKAQLPAGVHGAAFDPFAEEIVSVAEIETNVALGVGDRVLDRLGECEVGAFVGIEEEDPVVLCLGVIQREVTLLAEVFKRVGEDPYVGPGLLSERDGVVGAAGVDEDDVVDPVERLQTGADVLSLIEGENDSGKRSPLAAVAGGRLGLFAGLEGAHGW